MLPRRPFLIMSPTRSTEVGSPTMHQSSRSPRSRRRSQTTAVPSTEGPSSSLVSSSAIDNAGSGWAARNSSAATTKAAIEVFMSAAPRPYSLPSRCAGVNGSLVHCSSGPVGTTSVWPANTTVRPRPGAGFEAAGALGPQVGDAEGFRPAFDGFADEAQRLQSLADDALALPVFRGHGAAGDQLFGQVQRTVHVPLPSHCFTSSVISVNDGSSAMSSSEAPSSSRSRSLPVKSFCSRHCRLVGESA